MATINGTPGVDNLIGTLGDDNIFGWLGNDTLTGGVGGDRFLFNNVTDAFQIGTDMCVFSSDGFDKITDFSAAEDSIVSVDTTPGSQGASYRHIRGVDNAVNNETHSRSVDNAVNNGQDYSYLTAFFSGNITTLGSFYLSEISGVNITTLSL